jgi:hypothetical protein
MDNSQPSKVSRPLINLAAGLNPMKSISFLLALGLAALAAWTWFKRSGDPRPPFPIYGAIAASYAGGFLIGRLLWRFVKITAIVAALALGGLAVLNRAHVDSSRAREATESGSAWVRNEVSRAKHYLLHFLPSGCGAGLGAFAGGRRRGGEKDRN